MKTLIIKLGATGDVVRTTTLLHVLEGEIHWLTGDNNVAMLQDLERIGEIIPWSAANRLVGRHYTRIINLEDSLEAAKLQNEIGYNDLFGAFINQSGKMDYTDSSREWFDLSLISRFGIKKADQLKLENRKTFQDMLFSGLGYSFTGQSYCLPPSQANGLEGDIAIAPEAGAVWPMKNWAHFNELKDRLQEVGFKVNFLPMRNTLSEHIGDVQGHSYLISGDTLPMHIALGSNIKCLSIFICTSPWEIYGYGIQKKLISPLLGKYFYQRGLNREAVGSITIDQVFSAVLAHLE